MDKCEATLTEWQGVAVCEVCDWNENGSDGPHGEAQYSPADVYGGRRAALMVDEDPGFDGGCEGRTCDGVSMCPECSAFFDEFGEGMYLGYDPADHDVNPSEWQCIHGIYSNAETATACVTCTGTPDRFGTVRKDRTVRIAETGQFAAVRPDYSDRIRVQIPATVRGSFGISQVRAVVTSGETEARQWTDAPSEGDWAGDEDTPAYVQRKAHRKDRVPRWWLETERGVTPRKNVTPSWDEAIRQAVAAERAYLDSEALPDVAIVRGLVMADSGRKRGDVDVQAWRASAKHRAEYVSTFNMDDHIPAR